MKSFLKELFFRTHASITPFKRFPENDSAIILNYHHIIPDKSERNSLLYGYSHRITSFEAQLSWLQSKFQKSIDFSSHGSFVITFDDCSMSTFNHALPILEKYNVKAYFFVVEDDLGDILWIDKYFAWLSYVPRGIYIVNDLECSISDFDSRMNAHHKFWSVLDHGYSSAELLKDLDMAYSMNTIITSNLQHADRLYTIGQNEVNILKDLGHLIGFHSRSHQKLSTLPKDTLVTECTPLKNEYYNCDCIAVPFGTPDDYNSAVLETLREEGFGKILLNHPYRQKNQVYGRLNLPDSTSTSEIQYIVKHYINSIR